LNEGNYEGNALEQITSQTTAGEDRRLAYFENVSENSMRGELIQISSKKTAIDNLTIIKTEEPLCWRLGELKVLGFEEMVFVLRGVVAHKILPPVTEK